MIQPELAGALQLCRGPRRAEHGASHRVGDLDGRRPDPAADGMDQDPPAGIETPLRQQARRAP